MTQSGMLPSGGQHCQRCGCNRDCVRLGCRPWIRTLTMTTNVCLCRVFVCVCGILGVCVGGWVGRGGAGEGGPAMGPTGPGPAQWAGGPGQLTNKYA